ncbi:hypothetical protein HAZT_HAZT001574 [Hyalella azteca]|nr:hypothetical protein HAZT_HAZT001574 [Hyalella azteca]
MAGSVAVGMDLGTTFSCVGVWRNGRTEIIADAKTGARLTPSCVAFTEEGLYVGEAAAAQASMNPANTLYETKRLIGRRYSDPSLRKDINNFSYSVRDNGNNSPVIQLQYRDEAVELWPEQVSALVLDHLKKVAENYLDCEVTEVVITVPAYFSDSQRQATKDAARIAGLSVLRIINEPTAAALAYGIHRHTYGHRTVLVFDLGGGTFDVSLLDVVQSQYKPARYTVKAVTGDTNLGGTDFDRILMDYCLNDIRKRHLMELGTNVRAKIRLKKECEKAKCRLSVSMTTVIDVPGLIKGRDYSCTLTRAKFDMLCSQLFGRTMQILRQFLSENNAEVSSVDDVVLVGGSTRIPKIRSNLAELFGESKIRQTINADEAVATGAAVLAAIVSGDNSIDNLHIADVIPLSLGLADADEKMVVVMDKNTSIPARVTQPTWTTVTDFQTRCRLKVYEGEFPLIKDNLLLGSFLLENIQSARQGVPKLAVTFSVDENGILTVEAVDQATKNNKQVQIAARTGRLSVQEVDVMARTHARFTLEELVDSKDDQSSSSDEEMEDEEEEKEEHQTQEDIERLEAKAKDRLMSLCFRTKLLFGSVSSRDVINDADRAAVLRETDDLLEWMHTRAPNGRECRQKLVGFEETLKGFHEQIAYYARS